MSLATPHTDRLANRRDPGLGLTAGLLLGAGLALGSATARADERPQTEAAKLQNEDRTTTAASADADLEAAVGEGVDADRLFVDLVLPADSIDDSASERLDAIDASWHPGYVPMALETLAFTRRQDVRYALIALLEDRTGESFGPDTDAWYRWLWRQPEVRHPDYAAFKSRLYAPIDPIFAHYFDAGRTTLVRLDEVRWGGVRQDGIPPLREPAMIGADEADYLDDGDIVFALDDAGDARAYPKRILAWHEMFVDEIAGREYAGVYCTLCGAVIPYDTTDAFGTRHALGTSGFLYRSNKLMYDRATQSLWSTTLGEPVIGPLADEGIRLTRRPVVTTTWGEWRRRHPETRVLSLDTGHQRDYGEGVAYREYFASDEPMFIVPRLDGRLANKAEVLALQFPASSAEVLAIDTDYLLEHRVHQGALGSRDYVVFTDDSGANRVYAGEGRRFASYDGDVAVTDASGAAWTLTEGALVGPEGELHRLPAHRAFWFGWQAAHPDTRLIH